MTCTRHFLNLQWEQHSWRRCVTASETLTGPETNMWARVVCRDYVRCDKQDICQVCGATRRKVSCFCDIERAERCTLRRAWIAESRQAAE